MTDPIEAERNAYRSYFDSGVSEMMSRMWRGNLHIGMFHDAAEPLEVVQLRLKTYLGKSFGFAPGARIFEAACGVGTTAIHFVENYGLEVHATNISGEQLEEARRRATVAGIDDRISFSIADYHDLPEPSAAFDGWLCQEALLYARDRRKVFAEARRVVRPGGRIIFTDLTLSRDMPTEEREALTRIIRAPYLWSAPEYQGLVAELGMEVLDQIESQTDPERTFKAVAENLAALEQEFTARIGATAFSEARTRIMSQYEAARGGKLGWCLYCLRVPDAST